MTTLPDNWVSTRFGELNSYKSSNVKPSDYPEESFELYSVPSYPARHPEIQKGADIGSSKQSVEPNDVLVCKINPRINRVWTVMQKGVRRQIASSEWIVMRAPLMNAAFLRYYFLSPNFREMIGEGVTGVGGSLTRAQPKRVAEFPVPIAPIGEQDRIAEKLIALFEHIEIFRNRMAHVSQIAAQLKRTILAYAVSGALSKNWRTDQGISDEWRKTDIKSVASVGTGSTPLRSNSNYYSETGMPWVTSAATSQAVVMSSLEYVTDSAIAENRLKTYPPGTILVAMYGEGKTRGQVTELGISATINQACAAITVDDSLATKDFVKLALQANYFEMRKLAEGGNQPNLNLTKIKNFPLDLPSLQEQKEIVSLAHVMLSRLANVKSRIDAAALAVERLEESVLVDAFNGELEDRDENDEPAEDLLDRIRDEKLLEAEKPKQAKKTRKPTVRKISQANIKEYFERNSSNFIGFDELRGQFPGDYDALKEAVFSLLNQQDPIVEQFFDPKAEAMTFRRLKS